MQIHVDRFPLLLSAVLLMLFSFGCTEEEIVEPPDGWDFLIPGFQVMGMAEYGEELWICGREGLKIIDIESGLEKPVPENRTFPFTAALEIDQSGRIWIGHDEGVTIFDGSSFTDLAESDGLVSKHVRSLASDGVGMWIGTTYGASYFIDEKITNYTTGDGLLDDSVKALYTDSAGRVWFGSYRAPMGGVSVLENGTWTYFTTENGLPHNDVTSFAEDEGGSVWIGTGLVNRGGAVKAVNTDGFWEIAELLDESTGLAANKVRSIFEDSNGALWFGSEYNGVTIFHRGIWTVIDKSNGLSDNEVTCMMQDSSGHLLIGTFDGITRIRAGTLEIMFTTYDSDEGVSE